MLSVNLFLIALRFPWILSILFTFDCGWAYPSGERSPGIEVPPPEIISFMRRFGYLESNPSDSEALYHEAAIIGAIKNVQKYGALNQTGKLDSATLQLLSTPRCGVPDIEARAPANHRHKRYIVGARSWQKRNINYYIANWSSKIEREQIEGDLERAFEMWSRYNKLKFIRINDTSADIIIGFGSQYHGDSYPFDGPGNTLAHAFYPYEYGSLGGDVHFDEDENWKENSTNLSDGVDFYSVALHELGHSLGLAHSTFYSSIMFAYYKGPGQNILDYDDVLAMYELYVNKRLQGDDEPEDFTTTSTTAVSITNHDKTTQSTTTKATTDVDILPTYQGDYETVSDHKRRYTSATSTVPTLPTIALNGRDASTRMPTIPSTNVCQGSFDAVAMIRGAVYIFKRKHVWKLTEKYTIANGYPKTMHRVLNFLPEHIQRVDAVYERFDGATVVFTDNLYWIYDGEQLLENSPKNLTSLISTTVNVSKIDAAMMWPKNNLTYLFAGAQFWRIDDRHPDFDYIQPKSMQRWVGIPHNIDAAATLTNGKTYFFKDNLYWLYNNKFVRPERGYPRRASTAWLRCPPTEKTKLRNANTTVSFI